MARGLALFWAAIALVACEGGGGRTADPRCEAICVIEEPFLDGAYEICSEVSRQRCLDQCEARIEGVSGPCATCLLDEAEFGKDDDSTISICNPSTACAPGLSCQLSGWGGSCEYCRDDSALRDECIRTAFPRRETDACDADFRASTECASICTP